jgi:histidine triad (HIT) family protein
MAYDNDNIFARIIRGDAPSYRVFEDENTFAFLDVMPQSDGHTLVLPKTPAENLFDLDDASMVALMRTVKLVANGVSKAFKPDGIRLMQLNGPAAGQTVFHVHMHIVPCYEGTPRRTHSLEMAESAVLEKQAEILRTALINP